MINSSTATDRVPDAPKLLASVFDRFIAQAKVTIQNNATIPEQKDAQAWQEIERQRGVGKSDSEIWFDAARSGDREIVGALIRKPPQGFDVNQTDENGATALHKALFSDNAKDMVNLLVDEGRIDMAALDQRSQSAYDLAVKFGNKNDDELKGIAASLKDKLNGEAKAAQEHGDDKRLDALVKAGADRPAEAERPVDYAKAVDELDILNMPTGEKDASGKDLTVNEKTVKALMEKYKKGIDDGSIKEGDAQYKFYYAMQAQAAVAFGQNVVPYRENGTPGTSERFEGNPTGATGADMSEIYDPEKAKAAFAEASSDPKVMEDWKKSQDEAIAKLPEEKRTDIKGKIEKTFSDPGFRERVDALKSEGKLNEAQSLVQRLVASYSTVATKEEVDAQVSKLGMGDLVGELEKVAANPDTIQTQYWESAVTDWAAASLEALNRSVQLGRHGLNSLKLAEQKEFFEKLVRGPSKDLRETALIFKEFAKEGKLPETIPQDKLDAIGSRVSSQWGTRGPIRSFFTNLNDAGAFSTAIGTIALTGSIYQMTKGNAFGDDHLQNMQIARGFLLFLGTAPEITKLGSGLTKIPALAKLLGSGDTSAIFGAKTVADAFKVAPESWTKGFVATIDGAKVASANADDVSQVTRWFTDEMLPKGSNPIDLKTKFAAAASRVVGATSFTAFGMVDLALGGMTIKEGADKGDPITIAQGALQILTGGFTTVAGGAMVASGVFGVSAAAPLISPFLAAAAVVGLFIVGIDFIRGIVASIKEKLDDKATADQLKLLEEMDKQGLLRPDWREKYEFLVKSFYGHDGIGGENGETTGSGYDSQRPHTKEGESVFEAFDWKAWLKDYEAAFRDGKGHMDSNHYIADLEKEFGLPDHRNGTPPADEKGVDDNLNAIVSIYHSDIDLMKRTVPKLEGELKDRFKELMKHYVTHENINATPDQAAKWASDQVNGRIPAAFPEGTTNDEHDDGAWASDIFNGFIDKEHTTDKGDKIPSGKSQLADLARETLEETFGR